MGGTIRGLTVVATLLAPMLLASCVSDDDGSSCNPCEKRSCEPPVRNQGKNGEAWNSD